MNKQAIEALSHYLKHLPRLADKHRDARVQRALADDGFWYFIQTYFPHHIEHAKTDTSVFRQFIHKELYPLTQRQKKLLFTAYRGGAKTTTITQLYTLWELVRQHIRFGVIISATASLVSGIFDVFKTELEDNHNLIHDFDICAGSTWRERELEITIGNHNCKLMGYGAGDKIRGTKYLSYRPDYIVLDDIENDENVESKTQRDKLERWFKKAIVKLPSRKQCYRMIVVGTILHMDSLLKRLEQRSDFMGFNFPLVRQFPDNPDDESSTEGLILDDPDIDGIELMQDYREDKEAFMSEYQNEPITKEGLTFEGYEQVEKIPKCEAYAIGIDPSMGKKKGDYFGIAVLGKKADKFYASVKGYRVSPVKLIPRIIALYVRYNKIAPTTLSVETVQFQEFFKDVLKKEAKAVGVTLAVKELRNTAPKPLRIDSIAPLVNDGTLLINSADHLLIEELETYPNAAHDDLLDSLEMAYRMFRVAMRIDHKGAARKVKKRGFERFKQRYA